MSKADAWEHAARAAKEAHNLYKQPPRPKPKSKPAPNGWNKHTANAVSTELRVNDAELSSYIESAVDLVDNLEARNLEREADGMLFQCQLALKALAQAYAKYENKCSTPSWESLLAARSRGYAQLKRIEGFIAKRDKDKAEAIALNEKKLEASKVHLALVQEFQRRREIADGLAKEPKNDYVAAARVYGNAAKELDAFPYDVELFEPKDRDKFFELRKMAWARVAELEKFAKATKKLAAAQKRVAKKAAQLEVAVSAPPPTIPEEEEYVPPLPSPESPPPLPIADAPTGPAIPDALIAGTSAPVSTLSQAARKKAQKERKKAREAEEREANEARDRLAAAQKEEQKQLRAAQWASRREAEVAAQQARAEQLADEQLQRALKVSAEEAERQARREAEPIEASLPTLPPPQAYSSVNYEPNPDAESWQDVLRRQQEELERLRERLSQIEAAPPPVAMPLTAAVLAAIEREGGGPSSSSEDDALSVAPSTAMSVVTTATHLRNECVICTVKVPNAMCKPCGCVVCCQKCMAGWMHKTKGTRRTCPVCGQGLQHFVKLG